MSFQLSGPCMCGALDCRQCHPEICMSTPPADAYETPMDEFRALLNEGEVRLDRYSHGGPLNVARLREIHMRMTDLLDLIGGEW